MHRRFVAEFYALKSGKFDGATAAAKVIRIFLIQRLATVFTAAINIHIWVHKRGSTLKMLMKLRVKATVNQGVL